MGVMTSPASDSLQEIQIRLDQRIQTVDEPRWLSSRYAAGSKRVTLITLYAFYYELARVRTAVSDETLGNIRFQWWRDALQELARGEVRQHDVVLALQSEVHQKHLQITDLIELIDQFETAFLEEDRKREPDAALIKIVTAILAPELDPNELLDAIAIEWAGLRRGETVDTGHPPLRIVSNLRPGVAHFRLRQAWRTGKTLSALQQRLCILRAMLTGRI